MSYQTRPVVAAARIVSGLVLLASAVPALLISFGVIHWTAEQLGQFGVFLAVVVVAVSQMLGTKVEAKVTPVASPRDNDGNVLVPGMVSPPPI